MRLLKILFIAALFFVLPQTVDAAEFFVSTSGSDSNPGSASQPFRNIQTCLDRAISGDTCTVANGTYNEELFLRKSGTAGSPITLRSQNLRGATVNSGSRVTIGTIGQINYVTIDGLRLISNKTSGSTQYSDEYNDYRAATTVDLMGDTGAPNYQAMVNQVVGKNITGNTNLILRNCYIEGSVQLFGKNNRVENCELNGRWQYRMGITVSHKGSDGNVIRNNRVYNYRTRGIWSVHETNNTIIEGNTVYDIDSGGGVSIGINCDGARRPMTRCNTAGNTIYNIRSEGVGIMMENCFDCLSDGNTVFDNQRGIQAIAYGNATDWKTDGGIEYRDDLMNSTIRNNLVYNNNTVGVVCYATRGWKLQNNTIAGTRGNTNQLDAKRYGGLALWDYEDVTRIHHCHDWTVENNIFFENNNAQIWFLGPNSNALNQGLERVVFRNNLFYSSNSSIPTHKPGKGSLTLTISQAQQQFGWETNSSFANPNFVNSTGFDYRLQTNSPAIDTGYNIIGLNADIQKALRPQGNGFDIGAYEMALGATTPPTPTPVVTINPTPTQTASTAISIPAKIEAENYTSAFDKSPGNSFGGTSRDDVDVKNTTDGSQLIGWWQAGEWLEYRVNVTNASTYSLSSRLGAVSPSNQIDVLVNNVSVGRISVPQISNWNDPLPVRDNLININLPQGQHTIRFVAINDWQDMDYFEIKNQSQPQTTGDANNDGRVDGVDYVVWLNNFNNDTTGGPSQGDFNNDGRVDGVDYVVWINNHSTSVPTTSPIPTQAATPTPTSVSSPIPTNLSYTPPLGLPNIAIPANAKFVSPNGSNSNPGTDSQPFGTIAHGIKQLQAGDTLVIKSGTYTINEGEFVALDHSSYAPIYRKNGRADAWIKIVGDPRGPRPKIYAPWDGKSWQVFFPYQSSYIWMQYLEVYSNSDLNNNNGNKVSPFYILESNNIRVFDVWAHDGGGCGVCASGSNQVEIRGNHIWNNSRWNEYNTSGISLIRVSSAGGGPNPAISDSQGRYTNFVVGNLIWNNEAKVTFVAAPQWGITDGNCIIMDVTSQTHRTLIANNICSDNGGRGLHAVHYNNADFINNTSYHNVRSNAYSVGGGSELNAQSSSSIVFRNNVVWPRPEKSGRFRNGGEYFDNAWVGGNPGGGIQVGTDVIVRPSYNAPTGDWTIRGAATGKGAPWPLKAVYP